MYGLNISFFQVLHILQVCIVCGSTIFLSKSFCACAYEYSSFL